MSNRPSSFAGTLIVAAMLTPSTRAQSLNVDLGVGAGVPAAAYGGAAGQAGTWNAVSTLLPTALVDLAGSPTAVTVTSSAGFWFADAAGTSGDDAALLDDSTVAGNGSENAVVFSGLEAGEYLVYAYAFHAFETTGVTIVEVPTLGHDDGEFVLGAWPGMHQENVTYDLVHVTIHHGALRITVDSPFFESTLNGVQLVKLEGLRSFCFGDGGDAPGCTPCPCGNDAPPFGVDVVGGCRNSASRSGHLRVLGTPSVSADTLRFQAFELPPSTAGTLFSGDVALPANPAGPCSGLESGIANAGDGLRCIGGNLARHGARAIDASGTIGVSSPGWGPPDGPSGGLIAQGGFSAGQTRRFQLFHRDDAAAVCGSGIQTTQGVEVVFRP